MDDAVVFRNIKDPSVKIAKEPIEASTPETLGDTSTSIISISFTVMDPKLAINYLILLITTFQVISQDATPVTRISTDEPFTIGVTFAELSVGSSEV